MPDDVIKKQNTSPAFSLNRRPTRLVADNSAIPIAKSVWEFKNFKV